MLNPALASLLVCHPDRSDRGAPDRDRLGLLPDDDRDDRHRLVDQSLRLQGSVRRDVVHRVSEDGIGDHE